VKKVSLIVATILLSLGVAVSSPVFAECESQLGSTCTGTKTATCGQMDISGTSTRMMWCCESRGDDECSDSRPSEYTEVIPALQTESTSDVCETISDETQQGKCKDCMEVETKVWTALGCVDTTTGGFVSNLFTIGVSLGGGIALLLIVFGALQMMTSAGNPEKLNSGKELVTAAITGLLFIIFSIFLLQLIGYNIFGIPGFGTELPHGGR